MTRDAMTWWAAKAAAKCAVEHLSLEEQRSALEQASFDVEREIAVRNMKASQEMQRRIGEIERGR